MATSFVTGSLAAQAQPDLAHSRQEHALREVQFGIASKNSDRIEKGAQEFESMLLSSWLQQAEQSMGSVPGADDDNQMAGKDQMMSMGVQAIATSLAATGGIGIAKMISRSMHEAADKLQPR